MTNELLNKEKNQEKIIIILANISSCQKNRTEYSNMIYSSRSCPGPAKQLV